MAAILLLSTIFDGGKHELFVFGDERGRPFILLASVSEVGNGPYMERNLDLRRYFEYRPSQAGLAVFHLRGREQTFSYEVIVPLPVKPEFTAPDESAPPRVPDTIAVPLRKLQLYICEINALVLMRIGFTDGIWVVDDGATRVYRWGANRTREEVDDAKVAPE
jgi:hypothetical protein